MSDAQHLVTAVAGTLVLAYGMQRRGQWGWLADECELPIAETIAADLIGA